MIILGMMLDISIIVLYQKYMWVSHQRDLHTFDVYLILNKGGHFHLAYPKKGYKICVKIPDECRPMYIESSPAKTESHSESMEQGNNRFK